MTPPKTTQANKPSHAASARATFSAAAFGNLRSAAGEGQGEALRIPLADIDEDPDQPRTDFDPAALESMAESIRAHGVVRPIVVRPAVNGRYVLAFGARRLRASRLAGVADIPAVVGLATADALATQLIENQQRATLGNRDLAAAIARLHSEGATNRQIAVICALKDYQVAAFRQAGNFPPELAQRLDNADIRALYDLYRQWVKTPAAVLADLPDTGTFITVTEVRRIIGSITGKETGSVILDRPLPPYPVDSEAVPAFTAESARTDTTASPPTISRVQPLPSVASPPVIPDAATNPARRNNRAPVFIVALGDGETGRLVVNQRAEREGWVLVAYATGMEEVEPSALRIVGIE